MSFCWKPTKYIGMLVTNIRISLSQSENRIWYDLTCWNANILNGKMSLFVGFCFFLYFFKLSAGRGNVGCWNALYFYWLPQSHSHQTKDTGFETKDTGFEKKDTGFETKDAGFATKCENPFTCIPMNWL